MTRKHNVDEVIRSLGRKKEVRVNPYAKTVEVLSKQTELGNGSWGKIDFLTNHCGYRLLTVSKF